MNFGVQILIVLLYLAVTVLLGILSRRSARDSSVFMGTNIGLLFCVVAGAGEWMGGTSTTGVSEYGYVYGISGAWYTVANGLGIMFLALFFARLYRSLGKVTVSGIVGKYLGPRAGMISAVLLIFVMLAVGASQLVAIGTLGQTLLGLNAGTSIIVMGAGIILYTWLGGMLAVGYTNILHMLTMYLGIGVAFAVSLMEMGGFGSLRAGLPASYFDVSAIGSGKVASWIIASVLGACSAQAGIQPVLAAKDEKTAVKSSFLIALLVTPFGLLTAALGMMARVKFPNLSDAKLALPEMMMSMNPIVGGMVLAAMLAAVLSTASPIFLASGTLFTKDIYAYFRKDAAERQLLTSSRTATLISGVICIMAAVMLYDSTMLLDLVYFAYSIRGSIFVVLVMGIYWKRTTSSAAIKGMLITMAVGVVWVVYKRISGSYPIHPQFSETYAALLTAVAVTAVCSLRGKTGQSEK